MSHIFRSCTLAFGVFLGLFFGGIGVVAAACSDAALTCHEERLAYYGDLHVHTRSSWDAYVSRNTEITQNQAYQFARGDQIEYSRQHIRRAWPLDFIMLTDHSEYYGVFAELDDPNSEFSKSEMGRQIKEEGAGKFWELAQLVIEGKSLPGASIEKARKNAWTKAVKIANGYYQPGQFTTFLGYEWTSHPDERNLHRNVIFRGGDAPLPFSSVDSQDPEDLWRFLDQAREKGFEAISISHNANVSDGLMYNKKTFQGRAMDRAYAELRSRNEILAEISQGKGQSETYPSLSPDDEFADFEILDSLLSSTPIRGRADGSYIRQAYGQGLLLWKKLGVNPYKTGVVGGSDFHNGLSTSAEFDYAGGMDGADLSKFLPDRDLARKLLSRDSGGNTQGNLAEGAKNGFSGLDTGSGSLTGVWAKQNTRDEIFDALLRRETFATSGTRLSIRFFGGWEYPRDLFERHDWINIAYAKGVSMGSDLPPPSREHTAPHFIAYVNKAPEGANLDRIQIVKISAQNHEVHEKIYDVAWSDERHPDAMTGKLPPVGSTVNMKSATYQNTIGSSELRVVWTDPDFNPNEPALYYLRVLEIPTPRWSLVLSVKLNVPLAEDSPGTVQERGWSSPIWYEPTRDASVLTGGKKGK